MHAFDDAWEEGHHKTTISAENEVEAQKLANNYKVIKPAISQQLTQIVFLCSDFQGIHFCYFMLGLLYVMTLLASLIRQARPVSFPAVWIQEVEKSCD